MATQQEQRRRERLRRNQRGSGPSANREPEPSRGRGGGTNTGGSAAQSSGQQAQSRGDRLHSAKKKAAQTARGASNKAKQTVAGAKPGTSGLVGGATTNDTGGLQEGGRNAAAKGTKNTSRLARFGKFARGPLGPGAAVADAGLGIAGGAFNAGHGGSFRKGFADTSIIGAAGEELGESVARAQGFQAPEDRAGGGGPINAGVTNLNTDLEEGERRPENMRTDPRGRGPRGVIDKSGRTFEVTSGDNVVQTSGGDVNVPTEEDVEAATNGQDLPAPTVDEPVFESLFNRDGTQIEAADAGTERAEELQRFGEAPGLPGTPEDEQRVFRITDGEGGVGTVRASRGLRDPENRGTVSTVGNAAAAAIPIDTEGLQEARLAAIERGESVPALEDGQSRRDRLREEIDSTQGLNQSFSGLIREGIRRRRARNELDSLNRQQEQRQAANLRLRNARAEQQAEANQPLTPSERAEVAQTFEEIRSSRQDQRIQNNEELRKQADYVYERRGPDGERIVDVEARNEALDILNRSGVDKTSGNLRALSDIQQVVSGLNQAADEESRVTLAGLFGGGPDNPLDVSIPGVTGFANALGLAGQGGDGDPLTFQQGLQQIADVATVREDEDLVFDDRVVDVNGTEVELRQIPAQVQRMAELIRGKSLFQEDQAKQTS